MLRPGTAGGRFRENRFRRPYSIFLSQEHNNKKHFASRCYFIANILLFIMQYRVLFVTLQRNNQ